MKNLTEKQQTIIADITNEFVKINEEKSKRKKGGLIDLDSLLLERESDLDLRKSIELNNRINLDKLNQILNDDADKLNEDLADYNLIARIEKKNAYFIVIEELTRANKNVDNSIWINYTQYMNHINFKSKIEGIYKKEGYYIAYGSLTYKSIEDFVKSEYFIENLRKLINTTTTN
jgi:hypothetical protein